MRDGGGENSNANIDRVEQCINLSPGRAAIALLVDISSTAASMYSRLSYTGSIGDYQKKG